MAIKFDEPIGNSLYAPFLIRLGLGAYFILAGLMKLDSLPTFVGHVKAFGILPDEISLLYGLLLPYFEVTIGTLLVVGFWTTLASMFSSLMLISYIVALGTFPNTTKLFNKDIILLGGSLSLLFSGSGAYSLDRFRKAQA
jgi:uncharacterized membrane protein YphA (DoxX/SURF4 family)